MSGSSDTRYPTSQSPDYDERYLAGIVWFNRGDYFEAHEVWEDLWRDCEAADRRFYQSLIQAAVALYHWGNGNEAGASRLFDSGRRYMEPYRPRYRGLDVERFWEQVASALSDNVTSRERERPVEATQVAHALGSPGRAPHIVLDPPPQAWPDPHTHHDTDGDPR